MERSLKICFLEHKRPSSTKSEVSNHIHIESPPHHIDLDEVKILDREPHWFERSQTTLKSTNLYSTKTRDATNFQESFPRSSVPKSWPEIVSLSLMKDKGSSENFEIWKTSYSSNSNHVFFHDQFHALHFISWKPFIAFNTVEFLFYHLHLLKVTHALNHYITSGSSHFRDMKLWMTRLGYVVNNLVSILDCMVY